MEHSLAAVREHATRTNTSRHAPRPGRALQRAQPDLDAIECAQVIVVLARGAPGAPGDRGFKRRVHELLLLVEVHAAQPDQLANRGGGRTDVEVVFGIESADAPEHVAHRESQCLVDQRVDVVARCPWCVA